MTYNPKDGVATKKINPNIIIEPTERSDREWIEQLQDDVFGPGMFARAAFRVREKYSIEPSLSLIAQFEEQKIASVDMSAISLNGINGYLLGPLATYVKYRGLGAGGLLVSEVCKKAFATTKAQFVILVGDISYYGNMGFEKTTPNSIIFPAPLDQSRILLHYKNEKVKKNLHGQIKQWINE